MPEATVAAIIVRQVNAHVEVLLTLRETHPFRGYWCIPGGHIDKGESAEHAIEREVQEETHLTFSGTFYHYFDEVFPELDVHNVALVFAGKASGILATKTEEVSACKWVQIDEAVNMELAFEHNRVLVSYIRQKLCVE